MDKKFVFEFDAKDMPWEVRAWIYLSGFVVLLLAVYITLIIIPMLPGVRFVWPGDDSHIAKKPTRVVMVAATAYSSAPEQTDDTPCVTSTGFDVCENYALYGATNTIAANFLPVHTVVKIPDLYGDKTFVVRDRMNDRFTNRIDLWMPTRPQAVRFGIKYIKIEVY
ncbi:MAG: hypothetical protein PHS79_02455 [Patescibacteria group bacterium]|nr:hypothetical protein [Patescibacteria group bacterium]